MLDENTRKLISKIRPVSLRNEYLSTYMMEDPVMYVMGKIGCKTKDDIRDYINLGGDFSELPIFGADVLDTLLDEKYFFELHDAFSSRELIASALEQQPKFVEYASEEIPNLEDNCGVYRSPAQWKALVRTRDMWICGNPGNRLVLDKLSTDDQSVLKELSITRDNHLREYLIGGGVITLSKKGEKVVRDYFFREGPVDITKYSGNKPFIAIYAQIKEHHLDLYSIIRSARVYHNAVRYCDPITRNMTATDIAYLLNVSPSRISELGFRAEREVLSFIERRKVDVKYK